MPRNQETTSVDQARSTTRDPFGARATEPDDTAAMDDPTLAGRGADDPDRGLAGGTPVRGGGADGSVPPPEGEWVAGSRGSSATVPGQPAADNTRGDRDADTTPAFGEPVTPARNADISPAMGTTPAMDTTPAVDAGLAAAGAAFVTNADGYRAS